jgi:6-phosphogluconolactonase
LITASIFDTKEALYDAALRLMTTNIRAVGDGPAAIVVPGGRTPQPLFAAVAAHPVIPGAGLCIAYTDERDVPATDPQSNYALSVAMIQALRLPKTRVFRVQTSLPLEAAASQYHDTWRCFLENGGVISLAFLGLGEDGHTYSLFSPEQLTSCDPGVFAVAVKRETGPDRITVTPALLERIEHIVFLVTGRGKAPVVDAMIQESSSVTAALAVRFAPRVSLWYAPED